MVDNSHPGYAIWEKVRWRSRSALQLNRELNAKPAVHPMSLLLQGQTIERQML
jgi:hypothetical protein